MKEPLVAGLGVYGPASDRASDAIERSRLRLKVGAARRAANRDSRPAAGGEPTATVRRVLSFSSVKVHVARNANRLQDLERAVVTPELDGPRVRVCLSADRHRAGFVPPSQFWQREPVPDNLGPRRESIFTDEEGRMRIDRGRRI